MSTVCPAKVTCSCSTCHLKKGESNTIPQLNNDETEEASRNLAASLANAKINTIGAGISVANAGFKIGKSGVIAVEELGKGVVYTGKLMIDSGKSIINSTRSVKDENISEKRRYSPRRTSVSISLPKRRLSSEFTPKTRTSPNPTSKKSPKLKKSPTPKKSPQSKKSPTPKKSPKPKKSLKKQSISYSICETSPIEDVAVTAKVLNVKPSKNKDVLCKRISKKLS